MKTPASARSPTNERTSSILPLPVRWTTCACSSSTAAPVQADRAQRPSGDQHHGTRRVDAHRLGPRLAHGRAIGRELRRERADRRPQRQPDALHTAPGSRLEAGALVRRTDERSVTRAELVGHAGSGVLLMDDDGYAHPVRRGIHRSRGIAAESDHDVRVTRTQDIADLAGLAHPLGRKLERGLVGAPRERIASATASNGLT